jgi:excisionase family DNA binding protein
MTAKGLANGPQGDRLISPHDSRPGPHPVSPDPDQVTSSAARSAAATETGRPEPGLTERLAYSIDEAALLTGLSRDLLYDQMRHGNLTYVKIGRRRLITHHHLQQFLGDAPA